jgi:MoaA/NifB/PqqE/SkfB family radical SAM enzyme
MLGLEDGRERGGPCQLNFIVSYFCVSGCKTCYIWKMGKAAKKGELTLEEIKQLAQNFSGFRWIRFTGGEPFMREDLYDIMELFRDHSEDLRIANITTNCYNVDYIYDTVKRITQLGIDNLFIGLSLDGDRELHRFIRGVDSFGNVIDLFRKLNDLRGVKVLFSYTVSKYNAGRFSDTLSAVKSLLPNVTLADFNFNLYHTSPIYYRNAGQQLTEDVQAIAREFTSLASSRPREAGDVVQYIIDTYLDLIPLFLGKGESPLTCSAIQSTLMLDPYGNVYPCITWDKKLGNVRDFQYSIPRILQQSEIETVRKTVIQNRCPGCWTPCEAYPSIIDKIIGNSGNRS